MDTHYVYLISDPTRMYFKIGHTVNVDRRAAALQTPFEPQVLAKVKCPTRAVAKQLERYLHTVFSNTRIRKEWFSDISIEKFQNAVKTFDRKPVNAREKLILAELRQRGLEAAHALRAQFNSQ